MKTTAKQYENYLPLRNAEGTAVRPSKIRRTIVMGKALLRNDLMSSILGVSIFILLLLLTSCGGKSSKPEAKYLQQQPSAGTKTEKINAELVQTQKGAEAKKPLTNADYRVGAEDLLEITVFQAKELSTIVRVSNTGYIKLSLIDKIEATGMTVGELEALIAKKYEQFLQEPVVSVFVREYRGQQIAVLGSVRNPATYYVTGQRYLLDLLSMAGGLSPEAGDVSIIQRAKASGSEGDQQAETIVVDLDQLLIKGRYEFNVPVYSGDVIHVPKSGIFFVDGGVHNPGSFNMKGKTTLTQAISLARGFTFEGDKSDVKVFRDTGKPERDILTLDYKAIIDGKNPDFEIKDKDIIIVTTSGFKTFLKGFAGSLNFGAFSLGRGF